jgi:UDP-N-acetylmuramoyl-L-alanyl-D-glutamate--2,6-diaminopimelate ligase
MTIELGQLADAARIAGLAPAVRGISIAGLEYDSRRVTAGDGFFAFPGARADGRQFARDAVARGASAVFSESPAPDGFAAPWIEVAHGRRALALMSRRLYPSVLELTLTGITGTNGKTTTCYLIDSILRAAGHITGQVGTIEYHVAGEIRKAVNTTPESLDLYRLFDELRGKGGSHATMEVSSHALALGRVWGLRFAVAVFTNLTQDHLDFHRTMEEYFDAKSELFRGQDAPAPEAAVLNHDDEWAHRIDLAQVRRPIWYGLGEGAALRAVNVEMGFDGLRFDVEWEGRRWPVRSGLAGLFNVYNILAAFGAGLAHQVAPETIAAAIEARRAVPGRFERVDAGQPFLVVVDYSHTGDALRNAIQAARGLTQGRVITLFGCGGDRDRSKRPLMGQAAGAASDFVVLTSDNPRSEDPLAIISDALVGLRRTGVEHVIEPDRGLAIHRAIAAARPGDVVLLAGKGHEDYQVLNGRTIHFDDREVARQALGQAGFTGKPS